VRSGETIAQCLRRSHSQCLGGGLRQRKKVLAVPARRTHSHKGDGASIVPPKPLLSLAFAYRHLTFPCVSSKFVLCHLPYNGVCRGGQATQSDKITATKQWGLEATEAIDRIATPHSLGLVQTPVVLRRCANCKAFPAGVTAWRPGFLRSAKIFTIYPNRCPHHHRRRSVPQVCSRVMWVDVSS